MRSSVGSASASHKRDAEVIVIGAGAAGLAAAQLLASRSLEVTVLEARDRFGGRAWSQAVAGAETPAELGAEFIHGPALETMQLLRDAGMRAVETGDEGWTCSGRGKLRREERGFVEAAALFDEVPSLDADESVDQFLRRFEQNPTTREEAKRARQFVEGFDAADPTIASVQAIADEWRSGVDWSSSRPVGTYGPMFDYLRKACEATGARLYESTIVRRISWGRGRVTVEAYSRGEVRTFQARAAVVTVPAGVLRQNAGEGAIAFDPDLPATKRHALDYIEMGHVVKVVLAFHTPFWEQVDDGRYRDGAFFRCEGPPFAAFWTQVPLRSTLVTGWAGGPNAGAVAGTLQDRIESALRSFGDLFDRSGLARDEFAGGVTHDWASDPFARGAYSYALVGGKGARERLAAPVDDTLFFAGEATCSDGQGGTVNGALESGQRAGEEVLRTHG